MAIRWDFIFSNWIIIWFILYYVKIVPYSPLFALIIGFIENIYLLSLMILNQVRVASILHFAFIIFMIKIIPLYLIQHTIRVNDIIVTLIVMNLYLAWLLVNGKDFVTISRSITQSLVYDKSDTPIMSLLQKLENVFKG